MMDENNQNQSTDVQLTVEAELLDTGIPSPKPGVTYSISLMKYQVLKVIKGEYRHDLIFVGHHMPDLSSSDFSLGIHHRLHLSQEFPDQSAILDSYQTPLSATQAYFCSYFDVM